MTLVAALQHKHLLLVLDNFEQVGAAAPLVADLLAACPRLTVLATSRTPLHLSREQEFTVPPLTIPTPAEVEAPQLPHSRTCRPSPSSWRGRNASIRALR